MNQCDQNINKDMSDFDLIDVESLDFSDEQTWLHKVPQDSGDKLDIVDWTLSLDWPAYDDEDYFKTESAIYTMLDEVLKSHVLSLPDKHKFDSRTYVRPKRRPPRPSIHSIVESPAHNQTANKYMTYNKYNSPMAGPILRLKTFNVDTNTENSAAVKEYASKRRSLVQEDDVAVQDDAPCSGADPDRSAEYTPSKPINIDLSQPAHNLHNTFNKGYPQLHERGSLNMYQSGESLMRMSPPSLVSSLLMESSGNFNQDTEGRKSTSSYKDSGLSIPGSGRESIDPMMTSMTLSILDEKEMSTSFLSQTTYPEHDSLIDSQPPSLVNSVNSSFIISSSKQKDSLEVNNVFSSATFTHLEQSEKLLSARPRHQMFNSFTKTPRGSESYTKTSDSYTKGSDSYTKSTEESQATDVLQTQTYTKLKSPQKPLDVTKVRSENSESRRQMDVDMCETITLHYANNKFRNCDAEKENFNNTFEKDDAFYKAVDKVESGKTSLNVTLDKQELNEIIQARQKLSLARKALPTDSSIKLETSPSKALSEPVQVTVPRKSIENASELLARRRPYANDFDKPEEGMNVRENARENGRDPLRRNATFKKPSPQKNVDTTVVYVQKDQNLIDINSATMTLVDQIEKLDEEWNPQERAMVGSTDSTDTATFSSSSPPDSVPESATSNHDTKMHVESTPLLSMKRSAKQDLMNLHATISPIYDMTGDRSYTITSVPRPNDLNSTVINTGTIVKRTAPKRDILAGNGPEKQIKSPVKQQPMVSGTQNAMAPPTALPKKTGLPTSKLRQYSSHRDLRLPLGQGAGTASATAAVAVGAVGAAGGRSSSMVRRAVFASNPALSPTSPVRRNSYVIDKGPPSATLIAAPQNGELDPSVDKTTSRPPLVRQGTETLRRERPQSQLVAPKDLRSMGPGSAVPVHVRNSHIPPPTTRSYSMAGTSQTRVAKPSALTKQSSVPTVPTSMPAVEPRPSSTDRISALPRPSRLPAPRRTLRPPSVYSVAPSGDADHY